MSRKRVTRGKHVPSGMPGGSGVLDVGAIEIGDDDGQLRFTWNWLPDAMLPLRIQLYTSRLNAAFVQTYSAITAIDSSAIIAADWHIGQVVSFYVQVRTLSGELVETQPQTAVVL